jgi:hypothetical protein
LVQDSPSNVNSRVFKIMISTQCARIIVIAITNRETARLTASLAVNRLKYLPRADFIANFKKYEGFLYFRGALPLLPIY